MAEVESTLGKHQQYFPAHCTERSSSPPISHHQITQTRKTHAQTQRERDPHYVASSMGFTVLLLESSQSDVCWVSQFFLPGYPGSEEMNPFLCLHYSWDCVIVITLFSNSAGFRMKREVREQGRSKQKRVLSIRRHQSEFQPKNFYHSLSLSFRSYYRHCPFFLITILNLFLLPISICNFFLLTLLLCRIRTGQ